MNIAGVGKKGIFLLAFRYSSLVDSHRNLRSFLIQSTMKGNLLLFIIIFTGFPLLQGYTEHIPISFHHIISTDGLSNNSVRAITQDHRGFIWLGTEEGLNRYDGMNFTTYKNNPHDPASLASNLILYLLTDSRGYVWIATDQGLNRWDSKTDHFFRYSFARDGMSQPGVNFVLVVREDSKGRIWVGTVNGLHVYSYSTDSFTSFFHDPEDPTTLSLSHINDILEDHQGEIWITTHGKGMNRLNADGTTFTRIMPDQDDPAPSMPWTPTCIFQDTHHRYWVGTWDRGLLRFDPNQLSFEPVDETQNCNIRTVDEDRYGNLWIGTLGDGLFYHDAKTKKISQYQHDPGVNNSLSANRIFSFLEDTNGLFWAGAAGGGVNTFRHPKTQVQPYLYQPFSNRQTGLSDKWVMSIFEDSRGRVWIGTYEHGLDRYDPDTGEFKNYIYATEANKPHLDTVVINYVYSIQELGNGNLLIGTLGYGVITFDPLSEQFTFYNDEANLPYIGYFRTVKDIVRDHQGLFWLSTDDGRVICINSEIQIQRVYGDAGHSFSFNRLTAIEFGDETHLWVGTEAEGINLLDTTTGEITHFSHIPGDSTSISNNSILDIQKDRKGRIWIGTSEGLNRYISETGDFQLIQALQEYPSKVINGIVEDQKGLLWLSTNRGLIRYDPEQDQAKWYGLHNGIQGYEFNPKSCFAGTGGKLYFGGQYGFNVIECDTFEDYPNQSPVVLSSIRVKGENGLTDKPVWEIESIELPYTQNNLHLGFALLDYVAPKQNVLEYRLGETEAWQKMNQSQEILFADLAHGERILQVRGTNADGSLNQQTKEITILVPPPFWMTWRFICPAGFILLLFIYTAYKIRVRNIAKQNRKLQEKVREQVAQLKVLDGLLPICSYCKKVRDDAGYWDQVEEYITKRSQAQFSHGICPDCLKEHFPQYEEKVRNHIKNNE
jgi:ligand-binding sensor domain-containing protein